MPAKKSLFLNTPETWGGELKKRSLTDLCLVDFPYALSLPVITPMRKVFNEIVKRDQVLGFSVRAALLDAIEKQFQKNPPKETFWKKTVVFLGALVSPFPAPAGKVLSENNIVDVFSAFVRDYKGAQKTIEDACEAPDEKFLNQMGTFVLRAGLSKLDVLTGWINYFPPKDRQNFATLAFDNSGFAFDFAGRVVVNVQPAVERVKPQFDKDFPEFFGTWIGKSVDLLQKDLINLNGESAIFPEGGKTQQGPAFFQILGLFFGAAEPIDDQASRINIKQLTAFIDDIYSKNSNNLRGELFDRMFLILDENRELRELMPCMGVVAKSREDKRNLLQGIGGHAEKKTQKKKI